MRSRRQPFAAVLLTMLTACVTAAGARKAELAHALDAARIPRSPAEIWPEVRRFLNQRGYPLVGDDQVAVGKPAPGGAAKVLSVGFQTRVLRDGSHWLETDPAGPTRTRVHVEAAPAEAGGSRLRVRLIKRADMSMSDSSEWRDVELELALVERLDPALAARITGRPAPVAPAPAADRWARLRPLLGSWTGQRPDGVQVRWRFGLAGDGQFVEMHGTPLLFAGPVAATGGDEMGRISRAVEGDALVWTQFTAAGRVDRYRAPVSATVAAPLVFTAETAESLPAGGRARLTLRPAGAELEVALEVAETGQDLVPVGSLALVRAP